MKRQREMVLLSLAIALCSPRLATAQELEKRAIGSNLRTISPRTYEDLLPKVEARPYPNMDAVKATIEVMGSRNPRSPG
jgi:hypothetical protein